MLDFGPVAADPVQHHVLAGHAPGDGFGAGERPLRLVMALEPQQRVAMVVVQHHVLRQRRPAQVVGQRQRLLQVVQRAFGVVHLLAADQGDAGQRGDLAAHVALGDAALEHRFEQLQAFRGLAIALQQGGGHLQRTAAFEGR